MPQSLSQFHRETSMDKDRRRITVELLDETLANGEKMAPEDLLISYEGVLYPATLCSPENFKALQSFEARNDDIILAGYPKTGTNWLDQILNDLETTAGKYTEEEINSRNSIEQEIPIPLRLEFGDAKQFQMMKKLLFSFRRITTTHILPQILPQSIFKSKAKILLLLRNPKDTAVSYFHFYNDMPLLQSFNTWDEYFTAFMNGQLTWGSYFDYLIEWNKYIADDNVMVITYEEMKENQTLGMKKIAEFLGFSLSDDEIRTIAEKSTFKAMKEKSSETHGMFGKILFRKGIVGGWRELFTEAQSKEMDRKFEECLGGTKIGEKIKYGIYCKA
ncbi:PREDICTED: sulfotransferase 6B1-like isoform X2 [Gavialis gangeticus]|uniref:sulfotransferase 6B1-like isoform X2 n=1 Tax=Gavialis gangeticus TaxID=94835 RepID=UPI00092FD2F0|nr:PREDICTED: sulfotransferase 6B1-like isoform X2 [Gavialis gangeticus]